MGTLVGQVAVVTASTDGIGFAIARKLGREGAKVVVSSRKQNNVDKALQALKAENVEATGIVCHVGNADHRKALLDKAVTEFGGVDLLVSNAAVNPHVGTFLTTSESAFDKIMNVNVKATFLLVKETVPLMEKRGKGSIVLVSSIGGYTPHSLSGAYAVSKTALFGMTKVLADELAPRNIRVNCIAPGLTKTNFSRSIWSNIEKQNIEDARTNPMRRIGKPDECAGIVSFLCSDEASYITGETVVVAGDRKSRL